MTLTPFARWFGPVVKHPGHPDQRIHGRRAAAAAASLMAGERVAVGPGQVAAVLDEVLAGGAGTVDLTLLHVDGTDLFDSGGLGVPRADMPQIPSKSRDKFVTQLRDSGISVTDETVSPLDLKPTQRELNASNTAQMARSMRDGSMTSTSAPLFVSSDGYVLDGHHRWAAAASIELSTGSSPLSVTRVGLPIRSLLTVASAFNTAEGIAARGLGDVGPAFRKMLQDLRIIPSDPFTALFGAAVQHMAGEHDQSRHGWELPAAPQPMSDLYKTVTPFHVWFGAVGKHGDRDSKGYGRLHPSGNLAGFRDATDEDRQRLLDEHGFKVPRNWQRTVVPEDTESGLIAKGQDAKGEWHYAYSAAHNEGQSAAKFQRVTEVGRAMPELDAALARDLSLGDEDAIVVGIMRHTGARVGDEATNTGRLVRDSTYGASTLRAKHVTVNESGSVTLSYKGKDGVQQRHLIKDPALASAIAAKKAGKSGNDPMFPDATPRSTMDYIRRATGIAGAKNHDLRTYVANSLAASLVSKGRRPKTAAEVKKRRSAVGKAVAAQLGNTPSVALSTYINPAVFAPWEGIGGK